MNIGGLLVGSTLSHTRLVVGRRLNRFFTVKGTGFIFSHTSVVRGASFLLTDGFGLNVFTIIGGKVVAVVASVDATEDVDQKSARKSSK